MNRLDWPDESKFSICLTHDVDRIDKKWWHCLYYFCKTGRLYHLRSIFNKGRINPYWNFEKIMQIEEKYGVRSTFFFLEEKKRFEVTNPSTFSITIGYYTLDDDRIIEVIENLVKYGWEIGLHGSYDSYKDENLLRKEKKRIEQVTGKKVLGVRQHYLNLLIPETWMLQKDAGFKYDSSFGLRSGVGWREMKTVPFKPFEDEDFLVIPLTIMDVALARVSKDIQDAWGKIEAILKYAERNGCVVTVLWHQRVFNENEFPGWSRLYEKIIAEGKKRNAWFATCRDVYEWWV